MLYNQSDFTNTATSITRLYTQHLFQNNNSSYTPLLSGSSGLGSWRKNRNNNINYIKLWWLPLVSVFTHYGIRLLSNVVHSFKTLVK